MQNRQTLRTFYTLIVTQVFSMIGSEMTSLAVGIWVYENTGNATPLTLAAFFAAVPRIIAPSLAGPLADRWDRRYVMVIADAGQAVGTLVLMITFLTGSFELWHLYMVAALQAAFGMFQGPAFQASVTMLVPDEQRNRANAIQQITGPAAGLVAPAIAGLLITVIGASGVMAVDLFTFFVAITVVWLSHIPRPTQTAEGRAAQGTLWQEAAVGFRFLWARRPLFVLVSVATLVNFFFNGVAVLTTPYLLSLFDSRATLGLLLSVMSGAMVVGGVIMGAWGGSRRRTLMIFPGIIFSGIFLALMGMARTPLVMGVFLALMLLPIPMVNAAFMSVLQGKTPPDVQGRVFATVTQIAMLFSPIAFLLSGPLADQVFEPAVGGSAWGMFAPLVGTHAGAGIGLMAVIGGCMITLITVAFYLNPRVRHMEDILPDYIPATTKQDTETQGVGDLSLGRESGPTPAAV